MSDFTTSEGSESSVTARPPALTRARGGLQASVLHRLAMVFGLWLAVAVLYWPSVVGLDALWRNTHEETYTHGYLVLLISLWLIVRERRRLAETPIRPVSRALIALVLLSAVWVWSWRAEIQELHLMLLPLILFTAIVAALGWRVARVCAFPIGYLFFASPFWSDGNAILQHLSARMIGVLVWITGVPAFMQGDLVQMPAGTIRIAGGCSGLHALIVGIALATLYGEIAGESLRRRLEWIGVMGAVALIVNWMRIFIVVVAAYLTDMHSSLVRQHYWLGWWLFAAAFAGFLWWTGRKPVTDRLEPPADEHREEPGSPRSGFSVAQVVITLAVLAVLPVLAFGMDWAHSGASTAVDIEWSMAPPGWSGPQPVSGGDWHPHFVDPSGASLRSYTGAGGQSVEVFTVAYRIQTQHAKLLSYWNSLLGPRQRQLRRQSVRIANSSSGPWREMLAVDSAGTRSLIWSRYRVGHRLFVRPRLSQLWYGLEALVSRPPLSSLTALRVICVPDCKTARLRLNSAAAELQPTLR